MKMKFIAIVVTAFFVGALSAPEDDDDGSESQPQPRPVSSGGFAGLCARVNCGPGKRCRSDMMTQQAVCEPIIDGGGNQGSCFCPSLRTLNNRDINQLSFSGDSCQQNVKCTRTRSQRFVNLRMYYVGTQVFRTDDFPNFATMSVTCAGTLWTVNGRPFDEFDC